jgi:hypothetical protein
MNREIGRLLKDPIDACEDLLLGYGDLLRVDLYIQSLEDKIESMKCCGNCDLEDLGMEGNNECPLKCTIPCIGKLEGYKYYWIMTTLYKIKE